MYKKSIRQENRIAKSLSDIMEARRQMASGSMWMAKGDVVSEIFLIEAKTKSKPSKSFSIKREWLDKIEEEAFLAGKLPALAFSFGDNVDYFVVNSDVFKELVSKYRGDVE